MTSKSNYSLQCVNGSKSLVVMLTLELMSHGLAMVAFVSIIDSDNEKKKKICPVICSVTYWHTVPNQNIPEKLLFHGVQQAHKKTLCSMMAMNPLLRTPERNPVNVQWCTEKRWHRKKVLNNIDLSLVQCERFANEKGLSNGVKMTISSFYFVNTHTQISICISSKARGVKGIC